MSKSPCMYALFSIHVSNVASNWKSCVFVGIENLVMLKETIAIAPVSQCPNNTLIWDNGGF